MNIILTLIYIYLGLVFIGMLITLNKNYINWKGNQYREERHTKWGLSGDVIFLPSASTYVTVYKWVKWKWKFGHWEFDKKYKE